MVRFWGAILGLLVVGCGGAPSTSEPAPYTPLLLEDLQADAPIGVLPASPYPLHYDLNLTLDPRQARFGGTVTLTLQFEQAAQGFYLHGRDLDVTAVRVQQGETQTADGAWLNVLPSGVAWVDFGQTIAPGKVRVDLDYNAPFDVNLSGLFKVNEQGDAYALAKSESIQARRFMPGFDQPAFKAPFDITLTVPEQDVAISNSPVVSVTPLESGLKRIAFETTRPLPTYLLSLAVGSFDEVDAGTIPPNAIRSEPILLKGYARRGKGEELAFALETAPELVEIFEAALQLPYPYKKLDIVAAPQWPSGATELAAAITYRESRILAGDDIGPAARRSLLAIHAHEVGHMWFGNLVTPPWWDDLWLKEAFASWGEGASLSEMYPGEGYDLDAIQDGIRAMSLDSLASARAVREPILRNENVRNAYDAITYNKGLAVIGMVDAYFGADVFRPALGDYVKAYEDGVADSPQFFDIIGEVTNEPDLTRAFVSFVEQNGLPLLRLEPSPIDPTQLEIRQTRYAPLGSRLESDRQWTLPLCVRLLRVEGESQRLCKMLEGEALTLEALGGALTDEVTSIMPNADGVGYWRFALTPDLWRALAGDFQRLSPGEQLSALDSVGAAFEAGQIGPDIVWAFIREGAVSSERRVVQAALSEATAFRRLLGSEAVSLEAYRQAFSSLFRPRWEALDQHGGENPEQMILKSALERSLIRTARDPKLRQDLAAAAAAYIGLEGVSSRRTLTSDEFNTALAVGLQTYGADFLDQLLGAYEAIDDPVFRQAAAYALGENDRVELNGRILDLAYSGSLGSRESYTILRGQMRASETRAQTWQRIRSNFPEMLDVIPRQRKRATPSLASSICTNEGKLQLEQLFQTYGAEVEGYQRSLSQTRERIELCIALKAATAEQVQAFFLDLSAL